MDNEPTNISNSTEANQSNTLKQGYTDVNILTLSETEGENIEDSILRLILNHYQDQPYEIISITDEQRPTNYIKNLRPLKVVRVNNLAQNNENLFVFDIAECLAFSL